MKKTLISIIVPVYNVEKYISRCVESLIGQSYKTVSYTHLTLPTKRIV